jgi:ABC-type multidrug transport system fused ATPase/permease subunit
MGGIYVAGLPAPSRTECLWGWFIKPVWWTIPIASARLQRYKCRVPLVDVRNLSLEFATASGPMRVVDDVSFSIAAGETLGLVGESGSGKSVTALSLAKLLPTPPATYPAGRNLN